MSQPALLKSLKSLEIERMIGQGDQLRARSLAPAWHAACAKTPPELLTLISNIYFKTLELYMHTQKPVLQSKLSQLYNRTLTGILKRADLPHITMSDFLFLVAETKTAPWQCLTPANGNTYIVPSIVMRTYLGRSQNGRLKPDELNFLEGDKGPILNEAGLAEAYIPFGVEQVDNGLTIDTSVAQGSDVRD